MDWRIAFIGFGTVGQGFASLLIEKEKTLRERYGLQFKAVAISDPVKGSVYDPEGISLREVMSLVEKKGNLTDYPWGTKGWDSVKTIEESNANVIAEATPTNLKTGERGTTHIRKALSLGKHVITTNKGPIALNYHALVEEAGKKDVFLRFEGTVLSGTPALNLSLEALRGSDIREIRGIVNGTTNFILTEMEKGKSYREALREAQELGYAETDPTADVEGWDAVAKVLILGKVVMGGHLTVEEVERVGITGITLEDVERARKEGEVYKLIAKVRSEGSAVYGKVSPERVKKDDFLANVKGATNALTFVTDTLGEVTIVGPGAGRKETGFSLLNDLVFIHSQRG